MGKYAGWRNLVISAVLTFLVLIGTFQLKLALGDTISISVKTLCIGGVIAIVIGGIILLCRKPHVLIVISIAALVAWVVMRGDGLYSAAIFAIGSVGLVMSIPSTALILSHIPKCLKRDVS